MDLPLIHSPADIVRRVLVSIGAGTAPESAGGWPVFSSKEPDSPDQTLTVYNMAGFSDGRFMFDGELFYHPGIHVRVRALTSPAGATKAHSVRNLMSQVLDEQVTIDGTPYLIHCLGKITEVRELGDESPTSKRQVFTIEAVAALRRVS